jgi:outer membrane protein OmpA-like peptidoglycan-associated protein
LPIPLLTRREPTVVISLQHINFVVDTPIPTDVTQTVLPGYVKLLQQYKDRHMEIDGYVNSFVPLHGESDPLFLLSLKRAKFIYDYLVDAGFDPAKLSYKGMGNATPINPEPATRDEMNANMRVEIKVY